MFVEGLDLVIPTMREAVEAVPAITSDLTIGASHSSSKLLTWMGRILSAIVGGFYRHPIMTSAPPPAHSCASCVRIGAAPGKAPKRASRRQYLPTKWRSIS